MASAAPTASGGGDGLDRSVVVAVILHRSSFR
jgi:hypothetical protein